jgi:hypothetical protein
MDNSFLKEHAARCRSLADKADEFTKRRLLDLADKYDDRRSFAGLPPRDQGMGQSTGRFFRASMKRATRPPHVKCNDCGQRIIVTLAKKGICPACRVAYQGLIIDIRISDKSTTAERGRRTRPWNESG